MAMVMIVTVAAVVVFFTAKVNGICVCVLVMRYTMR